eukprot:s60_g26.t1
MQTQHRELALKSQLAVSDSVRRACRSFGITVFDEAVPVGDHQANGAAEITVQVLRHKAGMWLQQAARYKRANDRCYSGKMAMFAEDVLGCFRAGCCSGPRLSSQHQQMLQAPWLTPRPVMSKAEDAADGGIHKRAKFADAAFTALESTFLLDDPTSGEHVPKTLKLDDEAYHKRLNQVTSTDLSRHEHEDNPLSFSFNNEELDELEEYELNFRNDELY